MNVKKKALNLVLVSIASIISFPLIIILTPLKYLFKIQFVRVKNSRMGPLAGTEIFFRQLKMGKIKNETKYIGIANTKIANQQFFKMLQRQMKIISFPQPKLIRIIFLKLATNPRLNKWGLLKELKYIGHEYEELNEVSNCIQFTEEEEKLGQKLLKEMKIPLNTKFICFYARDKAYLDNLLKKRDHRHDFRNSDINQFLKSVEFITQKGEYAFRMGAKVEKEICTSNEKIIDYASRYRSDFLDIYLSSHCKMFLANSSGLIVVPHVFNIPVASVNVIPLPFGIPPGKNDLFIPKKIWSIKKNRLLSFREMIYSHELEYWQTNEFRKEDNLIPIENTSEEILDLTKEMYERLEGTWITTHENEVMQLKFKSLFELNSNYAHFPSRIGTKFLIENKYLLD